MKQKMSKWPLFEGDNFYVISIYKTIVLDSYFTIFFSEKFESILSFNGLELNTKSQSTMYIQRGRLTHVYASLKLIIGSDDGLSSIETNAITVTIMHLQLEYILFLSLFFIIHQKDWKIVIFVRVDRMLNSLCDFQLWPQPWPWTWIFKIKFWKSISGMGWSIDLERKGCQSIECWTHVVTFNFDLTSMTLTLDFQGKYWNCCISGMDDGSTHLEWKGCELDMMLDAQCDWPWVTVLGK